MFPALSTRNRRHLKITTARWRRRAIFLLGGIAVGAAAVALAVLADQAQLAFAFLLSKSRYAALVVTPLGFVASIFLTNRYFPNSQGSGIPQAIAVGGDCGGPDLDRADGKLHIFRHQPDGLRNGIDWLAIPLCGVAGGLMGGLFSRLLVTTARGLPIALGPAMKRHPFLLALVCGLAVAVCGLISGDTIHGTGYAQVKAALENGSPLPAGFAILKFLATAFAAISGIPGGIFSPSLAVGAGLGANVASLFHGAPLAAIMLLGMVSYFPEASSRRRTAFVIVTEMTDNHAMVVPVMAAALIAHATSRLVCEEGIYHALAKGFIERAAPEELA